MNSSFIYLRKSIRHQHSCNLSSNQRMVHKLVYSIHHWGKRSFVDLLYKQLGSFHLGFQWHILGKISFFSFCLFSTFWFPTFRLLIFERCFADYKRLVACDHIIIYYLVLTMMSFNHQWIFHFFQWKLYWSVASWFIRGPRVHPGGAHEEADVKHC